jgi:hydroxymethylpyrimidine pyrophosphatase-like HAD family hydrolase
MAILEPQRWNSPHSQIDSRSLVLATDLDGTLLAGTRDARRRIRDLFSGGLPGAKLVFVTGRGLESVIPLLSDPTIPVPDYIIADVGATIVHGDLRPVEPLHHEIAAHWPGAQTVLKALASFDYLERQYVPQERRCSFFVNQGGITPALRAAVDALGCDLLFSAGRYLDVLPRGIGKGQALRRLAEAEGFEPAAVVVAGDTLNDLSMLEAGFRGIVVGGAEPALIECVRKTSRVFIARSEGCGGAPHRPPRQRRTGHGVPPPAL